MKKQPNKYDVFIDNLSENFSKIDNFNLLHEDEKGKKLFNFVIKRVVEIHTFKTLFSSYYLPAASKSVITDLNEINKSKYRHILTITKEDLKENFYETVRLGYIGMFHKYENYVDDLLIHSEILIDGFEEGKIPLSKFMEQEFGYKIKNWHFSPTIGRINWIAICNKHYDGFPRKEPKHHAYLDLPNDERMKFTKEDFIRDLDILIKYYELMLQTIFNFALYKMQFEDNYELPNPIEEPELYDQMVNKKVKAKLLLEKIVELVKKI